MRLLSALTVSATLLLSTPLTAQEPVDLEMVSAIREEAFERSEVMDTLWWLTDRYGPRLTNSPQQRRASEWTKSRLEEYGMENAALEAWGEFGLGWSFERCVVEMTAPDYMPLIGIPKAWTSGLEGPVSGVPILVNVESAEDLETYRGRLGGKIVLNGKVNAVESHFDPMATRHDEESLAERAAAPDPGAESEWTSRRSEWMKRRELNNQLQEMFKEEGALVVIEPDAGRRNDYGVIMLGSGGSRDPEEERGIPQVTVSTEQFNRVARLIGHGVEVEMNVDVRTTFYDDDLQGYNVVAEIPGTDRFLRDEVVMIGAHFDSWHPGTGATDNGASSAVMIEVMRILEAVGAEPRRTIRIVLWTGEEQGLLGSKGYVKNHFGDPDTMELLPEHEDFAAYFNMDNGAGKLRGIYCQGNAAVGSIFEAWMKPFADMGAGTITMRDTGGTDHLSMDAVGLPGFQFIQDPMDYGTRTHHTNMDLYERVHEGDVMQASAIIATFAYHAAMRDEKLPRKSLPKPKQTEDEDDE
ncbi:MAG: M20/M25/M40 family metallo-hydrolase [Planctomycetota bacterium]|jgi:hypothetical protein